MSRLASSRDYEQQPVTIVIQSPIIILRRTAARGIHFRACWVESGDSNKQVYGVSTNLRVSFGRQNCYGTHQCRCCCRRPPPQSPPAH